MPRFHFLIACIAGLLPLACTAQTPSATPSVAVTATPGGTPAAQKITYSSCYVDGPYIAITFDDGPHAQNTPRLLDMLKQRKVKATFFMVGQCAEEYPDIVKRMVAEGHEVANHSWSHPSLTKLDDAGVRSQLERTHQAIVKGGGVAPKIMRPPYGAFTERQRRWAHGELGYKVIMWDVDPLDWKYRNAAHVESEILKRTVPGSIILAHDIHKTTIDAMPGTLDGLLAKGMKFVTVSELLAMDRPAPPKPRASPKPAGTSDPAATPSATPAAPSTTQNQPIPAPAAATPTPQATPTATPAAPAAPRAAARS